MTWLIWLNRIKAAADIVIKVVDTITITLNDPNLENHTNASIGLAKKHMQSLFDSLGQPCPTIKCDRSFSNFHEIIAQVHEAEALWLEKVIGAFILSWESNNVEHWTAPKEMQRLINKMLSQFPYSSKSRSRLTTGNLHGSPIADRLDKMMSLFEKKEVPLKICGQQCDHHIGIHCIRSLQKRKLKFGDIGLARIMGVLSDDFGPYEQGIVSEYLDRATQIMHSITSSSRRMIEYGHPIHRYDIEQVTTLSGQIAMLEAGASESYIHGYLHMIKAITILIPCTHNREIHVGELYTHDGFNSPDKDPETPRDTIQANFFYPNLSPDTEREAGN